MKILEIRDHSGNTSAKINLGNSQMFSLEHEGVGFLWGGGRPEEDKTQAERNGWQNSEIIMFPIVGPAKNGYVIIGGKEYSMAQHGTARHKGFSLSDKSVSSATFVQTYNAHEKVGGAGSTSLFPFDYRIEKTYSVAPAALMFSVKITNLSDKPMPFAIGWHPAFLTFSDLKEEHYVQVTPAETCIPLRHHIDAIKAKSKSGSIIESSPQAEYFCPQGRISVKSDLGYIQLWSPEEQSQLCIEPISARPDPSYEGELAEKPGYRLLAPRRTVTFAFRIEITSK